MNIEGSDERPESIGDYLTKVMGGQSQTEVASQADMTRSYLNMIIMGHRPLTRNVIEKLESCLPSFSREKALVVAEIRKAWEESAVGKNILFEDKVLLFPGKLEATRIIDCVKEGYIQVTEKEEVVVGPTFIGLTRGDVRVPGKDSELLVPKEDPLVLAPGETVVTSTLQEISLPPVIIAHPNPYKELGKKGISFSVPGQLDTLHEGVVSVLITNSSSEEQVINGGDRLLDLELLVLSARPNLSLLSLQ